MAKQEINTPYLVSIEEFLSGNVPSAVKDGIAYLETHMGFCRVSHIRWPESNPWAVCPDENAGFGLSFAVHNGTTLHMIPKA